MCNNQIINKPLSEIIGKDNNHSDTAVPKNTDTTEHILRHSNIPKRYRSATIETKNKSQEKLVLKLKENFNKKPLQDVRDMLIMGSVGVGKTYTMCGFMNKLAQAQRYCRYVTEHQILDLYFQKRYAEFEAFKKVDVLIIDELGKRDLVDWQKIQLEELISYRYNEMLPTIYITNMNAQSFKSFIGDRVIDRLIDNNIMTVNMLEDSLRGQLDDSKRVVS